MTITLAMPIAADHQRHGAESEQQCRERRVGRRPRREGVRRPADVDLLRVRAGWRSPPARRATPSTGPGRRARRRVEALPSAPRRSLGDRPADQRRPVELGRERHRVEDADDGEPAIADPDLRAGTRSMPRRSAASAPSTTAGQRSVAASRNRPRCSVRRQRAEQVGLGRRSRRCRRSPRRDESVRRTVALGRVGRRRHDSTGADAPDHRRRASSGSVGLVAEEASGRARPSAGSCRAGRAARAGRPGWTRRCRPPPPAPRCRSRCRAPTGPPAAARVRRPSQRRPRSSVARRQPGGAVAHRRRPTIAPSRSSTRRGSEAAISRSWVITRSSARRRAARAAGRGPPSPERAVEVAGRLVGQHDRRLADERAGDRHALALAAGELAGPVPQPVAEARPARAPPPPRRRRSRERRRRGRAARRRRCRRAVSAVEQVELLEHEADRPGPQRRQLAVGQRRRRRAPASADRARRRPVERADHVQQRRLARARRADDRRPARPRSTSGRRRAGRRPSAAVGRARRRPARSRRSLRHHHERRPRRRRRRCTWTNPSADAPSSTGTICCASASSTAVAAAGQGEQCVHGHRQGVRRPPFERRAPRPVAPSVAPGSPRPSPRRRASASCRRRRRPPTAPRGRRRRCAPSAAARPAARPARPCHAGRATACGRRARSARHACARSCRRACRRPGRRPRPRARRPRRAAGR